MISTEVWVDIHSLHQQGKSIRQIARECGLARKTVRRYLRRMGGAIPSIPLIASSVPPSVLDAGGDALARRGVSAEQSSGRFRLFRPIVVPTGPALRAIGANAVLRPSRVRCYRALRVRPMARRDGTMR